MVLLSAPSSYVLKMAKTPIFYLGNSGVSINLRSWPKLKKVNRGNSSGVCLMDVKQSQVNGKVPLQIKRHEYTLTVSF